MQSPVFLDFKQPSYVEMTEHFSCPEEPGASPGGKVKPRPQATGQEYESLELWFVIVQSSRVESWTRKRRGWQRLTALITWWGRGVKNSTTQVPLLEIQNSAHLPEGHPSGPSVPKGGRLGHRLCVSLL